MRFTGIDIVLATKPADSAVQQALAKVLGVDPTQVALIDDVESYPNRESAEVVCIRSVKGGEYPLLLSLQCAGLSLSQSTNLEVVRDIARALATSCLMPTEDENPYVMWQVTGGESRLVRLEVAELEQDRYTIAKEAVIPPYR